MTQIKLRRDTSANFTSKNPILGVGEPAYETDTKKLKIGDGTTAYTQLEYFSSGGGGSADIGAALPLKIVDGVISLEVDGQTIQIVDGKLHASNNIFDISKFNVVGNPTITDDGIASGFSNKDYITIPFNKTVTNFKIHYPFKTLSMPTVSDFVLNGTVIFYMSKSGGTMSFGYGSARSGNVFMDANNWKPNTNYCLEVIRNSGNTVTFNFLNLDTNVILKSYDLDVTNVIPSIDILQLSKMNNMSIDLKQFLITVDGKEVFNGLMSSTKPIYDAIKASNTELSEFKTETSNDFSAVNSALNEKANLSDLALKQNKLTAGENITLTNLTDKTVRIDATYTGLEICDIGMALYIDETKGLRRYLNGQIVDINTNTQAFLNRLKQIQTTNPDYFTTEDNWQAEALLNIDGCVYKFVLNYAEDGKTVISVRLPKYPDYVEINAGGTLPVVGNGMTLGLTNGTQLVGMFKGDIDINGISGVYGKDVGTPPSGTGLNSDKSLGITTDPTKSGIETTLKQTKLKLRYFIQIATGSETENNIVNDIELNNPYSLFDSKYSDHELNNLSWLKSNGQWNAKAVYPTAYDKLLKVYNGTETVEGLSIKLSTETYTDYDFVLNTADETFRLPLKTKLASGKAVAGNGISLGLFDAKGNYFGIREGQSNPTSARDAYGVLAGSTSTDTDCAANDTAWGITTDPTKSGIELSDSGLYLYYYVGETVQNANLIDAGRIGEQLATKEDINTWVYYQNGTSGYRYNRRNGYCEQWGFLNGGTAIVTLLKKYKDTNYEIYCQWWGGKSANFYASDQYIDNITSGGFHTNGISGANVKQRTWRTFGYLAQGEY